MTAVSGGLRKRRRPYLTISSDTVNDRRLSFKARGILSYLPNKPDGWAVRAAAIAADSDVEGVAAIQSGLRELARQGYYRIERIRLTDGRMVTGTAVSEDPVAEWAQEYAEYNGPVPVVQQADGSFKVRRKDGTLTSDGFDGPHATADPDAARTAGHSDQSDVPDVSAGHTETRFSDFGSPDVGFPDVGSAEIGKPPAFITTEQPLQRHNAVEGLPSSDPPPPPAAKTGAAAAAAPETGTEHGGGGQGTADKDQADIAVFFAELGQAWPLSPGQRERLGPFVTAACEAGWASRTLAEHVGANTSGIRNPFAVLRSRLIDLPSPPVPTGGPQTAVERPPWCGRCDGPPGYSNTLTRDWAAAPTAIHSPARSRRASTRRTSAAMHRLRPRPTHHRRHNKLARPPTTTPASTTWPERSQISAPNSSRRLERRQAVMARRARIAKGRFPLPEQLPHKQERKTEVEST